MPFIPTTHYLTLHEFKAQCKDMSSELRRQKKATMDALIKGEYTCAICLQQMNPDNMFDVPATCSHVFCSRCLGKYLRRNKDGEPRCPTCREHMWVLTRVSMRSRKPRPPTPGSVRAQITKKHAAITNIKNILDKAKEHIIKLEGLVTMQQSSLAEEQTQLAKLEELLLALEPQDK